MVKELIKANGGLTVRGSPAALGRGGVTKGGGMKIIGRFGLIAALVIVVGAGLLYLFHKPIVASVAANILSGAGVEKPRVKVGSISLSRLDLEAIDAAGGLALEDVVLDYDWRVFFFDGKATSLAIGGGTVGASLSTDGRLSIDGWTPKQQTERRPPPFDALRLVDLKLTLKTPAGAVEAVAEGALDLDTGGLFSLRFKTDRAGFAESRLEKASGEIAVVLDADGALRPRGGLKADIATPSGIIRSADFGLGGAAASWKKNLSDGAALRGMLRVSLNSAAVTPADAPLLGALGTGGAPIKALSANGAVDLVFEGEKMGARFDGGAMSILADRGDNLVLSSGEGPLFERGPEGDTISLKATLTGPVARGEGAVRAVRAPGAPWEIRSNIRAAAQSGSLLNLNRFTATFTGTMDDTRVNGETTVDADIRRASVGRFVISRAPIAARLRVDGALGAKTLSVTPAAESCIEIAAAAFTLIGQDTDASLRGASFCAGDAPLAAIRWGDKAGASITGRLAARSGAYRIGQTNFKGAPPLVDISASYDPATSTTLATGAFQGGRAVLNEFFALTSADGSFSTSLVGDKLSADADLRSVRIEQTADAKSVAPITASGALRLADDVATFDFAAKTLRGQPLGDGVGRHDVKSGAGEATFNSRSLDFTRGGLQPQSIIPVLVGVIFNAAGAAEGEARFTWAPGVVGSSATFALNELSFGGPGVAVTRTSGVDGDFRMASLSPLKSDGEQVVSIDLIDLDALKLENGEVRFELPGDDTLKIIRAEFPWFGGVIGAYDSTMSIAEGGAAETQLKIAKVNLSELLAYLKIDGLSGEGVVEGTLPISFAAGKARIVNGSMSAVGPGVLRYQSKTTDAAAATNSQTALAFDVLRELKFTRLTATVDGALDGDLDFKIYFEGIGDIPVQTRGGRQLVASDVILRLNIEAPLLALVDQARLTTDYKLQLERGGGAPKK